MWAGSRDVLPFVDWQARGMSGETLASGICLTKGLLGKMGCAFEYCVISVV